MIPCLLLKEEGLVKTVRFKHPNYIGDPINAIRIFNEKEVDELIFLDIDASKRKKEPDYAYLSKIADQCFMPLCYGGGVTSVEQMQKIFALGFEKVSVNAAAYQNPEMVREAVARFGSSSIVGAMDIGRDFHGRRTVKILNGRKNVGILPVEYAKRLENLGVGEILVNDICKDGMMQGYDCDIIEEIANSVQVPVIACGGAGKISDCLKVVEHGASAAAAGSIFVYWGRLKGVLINYPQAENLE